MSNLQSTNALLASLVKKNVLLQLANNSTVAGELVSFSEDCVMVKRTTDKKEDVISFIVRNTIVGYTCKAGDITIPNTVSSPTEVKTNIRVLGCMNPTTKCKGVVYLTNSEDDKKNYRDFMSQCPCVTASCKTKNMGGLAKLEEKTVQELLNNVVLGTYPEKGE